MQNKWQPVLDHPDLPEVKDSYKRAVTSMVLENQEKSLKEDAAFLSEAAPTNATGSAIQNWNPILISLVRRAMPNLIAYDIAGVQPMSGPTGLIFAMRSRYASQSGGEALFDEADTDFSGRNKAGSSVSGASAVAQTGENPAVLNDSIGTSTGYTTGTGMTTAYAEALGDAAANPSGGLEEQAAGAGQRAVSGAFVGRQGSTIKARRRRISRLQQHNRRRGDGSTTQLERRAVLFHETPRRRRRVRRCRASLAARHRVGGAWTRTGPPGRQEERDPTHHRAIEPRLLRDDGPRAYPAHDRGQTRPRQRAAEPTPRRGAALRREDFAREVVG